MRTRAEPIVGIDLGTTYSVLAVLEESGRPVTIPNLDGDLSTPSVVLFEDDALIVGKEAQRIALVEPNRVADCSKRDMGAEYFHREIEGRRVSPQMIAAVILKRLKADAERRIGPIRRAVITVPAYFDHSRREATAEAGRLAGLEVVDVLNEPTAAALAYAYQEGLLDARGGVDARKTILKGVLTVVVYDLGGGTFDVTVMQIRNRQFKTLVTDGDVHLGGRDWDKRIVDHAAEQYLADHPGDDPRRDDETLQALYQAAEAAKRTLGERAKTRLVYTHRGRRIALEITRTVFEELTADLLDRTRATTKLVMEEAGLEWTDVDKLLLSGGSTRMPQVLRMLQALSGLEPDRSISPDEAVAHGAALYHGVLLAELEEPKSEVQPPTSIINVNSHSLGVVAKDRESSRLYNSILIPKNTPLPHSGSQTYQTVQDGQKRVIIHVVEGEAIDPKDCMLLGEFVIEPLPPGLPQGSHVRVLYSYDRSGRIKVEAILEASRARAQVKIARRDSTAKRDAEDWIVDLLNQEDLPEADAPSYVGK